MNSQKICNAGNAFLCHREVAAYQQLRMFMMSLVVLLTNVSLVAPCPWFYFPPFSLFQVNYGLKICDGKFQKKKIHECEMNFCSNLLFVYLKGQATGVEEREKNIYLPLVCSLNVR